MADAEKPGANQVPTAAINLDFPRARLHQQLQRTIDLVSFALIAAPQATARPLPQPLPEPDAPHVRVPTLHLPEAFLQITLAQEQALDFEAARAAFSTWILAFGLREAVEAVGDFLEEVRITGAALSFGPKRVALSTFNTAVARDGQQGRRFRQANFPDKIRILRERFGFAPQLTDEVLSINRARACLVHRRGVVAVVDCDAEGTSLKVKWVRLELRLRDSKGERPAIAGAKTDEPTDVLVRQMPAERTFSLTETVMLSQQDFADICFAISLFAHQMRLEVTSYAQRMGFAFPPQDREASDRRQGE